MLVPPDPYRINPQAPGLEDALAALPRRSGIYVLEAEDQNPYLGWTSYLQKRLRRLLLQSESGFLEPLTKLRKSVQSVAWWPVHSRLENWLILYSLARRYYPEEYSQRLKLRSPWFLSLLEGDEYPRLRLSNRTTRPPALTLGPFRTRDLADAFEQGVLGLFQIRRCEETLEPRPDHPGCIYGEMNLCLRPCQTAVSKQEYASEVHRVNEFILTDGQSLLKPLLLAREQASETMDFEQAARVHKQIDRVKAVAAARDPLVKPLDQLNGIAITRGAGEKAIRLWPMLSGYWQQPLAFDFSDTGTETKSIDQLLREQIGGALANPVLEGNRSEELGLLSRWYHSTWRDGGWVSFQDLPALNYRRLVKEISQLLKPS